MYNITQWGTDAEDCAASETGRQWQWLWGG